MSSRYIYIYLGLEIVFVLAWAYVCTLSPTRLRGRVTFLATFCFVYPPYEVAMPSRQNDRNARSRALRALETPEEKLVRRAIRNEKDRARRRRAKTKQKQVAQVKNLTVFCSHTKHAWNSCNYREHASLASLFCAIRAHH